MRKEINCPVELSIAKMLDGLNIKYLTEIENEKTLDFYLPDYDIYIECAYFYSDRKIEQLSRAKKVIYVQGLDSAKFLLNILKDISHETMD